MEVLRSSIYELLDRKFEQSFPFNLNNEILVMFKLFHFLCYTSKSQMRQYNIFEKITQ